MSFFCKTLESFVLSLQILIALSLNDIIHVMTVLYHVPSISGFFGAEAWLRLRLIRSCCLCTAHWAFSSWWELIRDAVSCVKATIRDHSLWELRLESAAHLNRGKLGTVGDTVARHDAWASSNVLYGHGRIQRFIAARLLLYSVSLVRADYLFL